MKIRFSRLAIYKLEKLSEYLIDQWSAQSNLKFLKRLDSKIQVIRENPEFFPQSELQSGLRKFVVTKGCLRKLFFDLKMKKYMRKQGVIREFSHS